MKYFLTIEPALQVPKIVESALLQKFYSDISPAMLAEVQDHFEKESNPDGTRWLRFRRGTTTIRPRRGGTKLLRDTGKLFNSMVAGYDIESAYVKTDVVYAHRHDRGTYGMPQRQFFWLSEIFLDEAGKNLEEIFGKEIF